MHNLHRGFTEMSEGDWLKEEDRIMLGEHSLAFSPSSSSGSVMGESWLLLRLLIQSVMPLVTVVTSQTLSYPFSKTNVFQKPGFNNLRELVF